MGLVTTMYFLCEQQVLSMVIFLKCFNIDLQARVINLTTPVWQQHQHWLRGIARQVGARTAGTAEHPIDCCGYNPLYTNNNRIIAQSALQPCSACRPAWAFKLCPLRHGMLGGTRVLARTHHRTHPYNDVTS